MSEAKPVGFLGSLLMPRDPSESSPYSGSVFVLSFFLDYISGLLDCLCFLWRDQNGHAALDGTDKKQKAKVMLSFRQVNSETSFIFKQRMEK